MNTRTSTFNILLLSLFFMTPFVLASEKDHYDRVNLNVEAASDIENDTLIAVLYTQREGSKLSKLSSEVNQSITQGVKLCKKTKGVDVQTLAYQTYPVYKDQRVIGWRVRQSIQVKSKNIKSLSKLIGDLQESLAVESIGYIVSREQREKIEEELIGKAITAFQARAQNITRHLGHKKYRLVNMDVRTNGSPVQPMRMRTTTRMMEADIATPMIEPGKQALKVTASGIIELVVD